MEEKELKFVNKSPNQDPEYATLGSSGFDIRAWITEDNGKTTLKPFERKMIHTGLYFDLPEYTEIQVRSRSGLSIKKGLIVLNTPGTVDQDYTGELCVLVINLSNEDIMIENGDRIAQAVLCPVYNGYLTFLQKESEIVKETERGNGGFGHSGIK